MWKRLISRPVTAEQFWTSSSVAQKPAAARYNTKRHFKLELITPHIVSRNVKCLCLMLGFASHSLSLTRLHLHLPPVAPSFSLLLP